MEEVVGNLETSSQKKWLRMLVGYGVTIVFVYVLIQNIDVDHLLSSLKNISVPLLLMAVFALGLAYTTRAIRWGFMLRALNKEVKPYQCIGPFFVSIAVNNVLPLRAGDLMRLFGFRQLHHLTPAEVLSTLMVERILDLLMLLSLFFITLPWVAVDAIPPSIIQGIQWLSLGTVIVLLALMGLPNYSKRALKKLGQTQFIQKRPVAQKIMSYLHRFIDAVQLIRSTRLLLLLVGLSIFAWACEGTIYLIASLACHYEGSLIGPYFASTLGTLSTLIPSAPGFVGTFDYFTMLGFQAFNVSSQMGTTIAILVHMVLWLPVVITGLIFYCTHRSCRL